jgi:hypothetical protein
VSQEPDCGEAGADADQRGDDRQRHRRHRPEEEQKDDHRGDEADHLAGLDVRLGYGVTEISTLGDLEARVGGRRSVVDYLLGLLLGQVGRAQADGH